MQAKRSLALGSRLALIAVAAAGLAACDVVVSSVNASGKAQDEWSRAYSIAPNGRLEVVNTDGLIEVLATDGQQVQVRAERIARGNTNEAAAELLKQVQIRETVDANQVRLETVLPSSVGFGRRGEVRYYLKVPAGVSVRLQNTNGQVRVDGIRGEVRAETTNGGVRGRALSGTIDASSTNGGVDLDVSALAAGGITARTTNGGVQVTVPENVKAQLTASCRNGGVSVSGLTVEGESSRTRVEGRINGGGPRIALQTTNGGIRVRAGSSAAR
jgi:DUF4097 and DUF4098 domain-containing protein YvlB